MADELPDVKRDAPPPLPLKYQWRLTENDKKLLRSFKVDPDN